MRFSKLALHVRSGPGTGMEGPVYKETFNMDKNWKDVLSLLP